MTKIILASHGDLSKGMLNSITMVVGELARGLETYSLIPGENPNDYAKKWKQKIIESDEVFVFVTDIKGGSVYNALLPLCMYHNVVLLTGMNMNMVLELVLSYDIGNKEPNYVAALENAKEEIMMMNYTTISTEIKEEEF